jgi:hypothetical protein
MKSSKSENGYMSQQQTAEQVWASLARSVGVGKRLWAEWHCQKLRDVFLLKAIHTQ